MMTKKEVLATDIYCITSEEHSKGRSNLEVAQEMIEAGVEIIQYREKEKDMLDKYQDADKIRKLTREAGVTMIVNDDIDLALAIDADGVHVGQEDLPVDIVRKLVGEEKMIGLSTHKPQQAREAVTQGVDYIGVGPIFATETKEDVCAPVGLEYLEYVADNIDLPFVAIGGIKEDNVEQVVDKGASCVAMITEIVGAEDIQEKIAGIREKMS